MATSKLVARGTDQNHGPLFTAIEGDVGSGEECKEEHALSRAKVVPADALPVAEEHKGMPLIKVTPGNGTDSHGHSRTNRSSDNVVAKKGKLGESNNEHSTRACGIIDPRHSAAISRWDIVMTLLLLYTAVVTPFEVAFLSGGLNDLVLFVINRVVDVLFICDIGVNFSVGYFDEGTNKWIFARDKIVRRYAHGWFIIDFLSCLPFDFIGLLDPNNSDVDQLKLLRFVRLFRLIKLLRILRSGRLMARIQSTTGLPFSMYRWVRG